MSEDPAKLKEMVTLYKQGLLVNPKDTRKRYQLASAYHKLGELDKAIKEIGEYDVPLKLHADTEAELNVIVESETPVEVVADEEAEPAAAE